jgi:hypothetical protein
MWIPGIDQVPARTGVPTWELKRLLAQRQTAFAEHIAVSLERLTYACVHLESS